MPKTVERITNQKIFTLFKKNNFSDVQAKILANRITLEEDALKIASPKLSYLENPNKISGMGKAVERLISAIKNSEIIGIETDHDCDGQTSHAVLFTTLTKGFGHPIKNIRSYIGHRMKEGYGLSEPLAKRIIADTPKPTLIITADNGSADEERIALLKTHGIDTIVTDHHAIPRSGIPKSAYAVLNPIQEKCQYSDTYIAGCMVAWLFMAQTKNELQQQGWSPLPDMRDTLDYVAVGTIADCVSMSDSVNNRVVTKYGLNKIQKASKTCWQVLQQVHPKKINSEYIGFTIGPLLNSDGRLSDAFSSVSFLLSEDKIETNQWIEYLSQQNENRKAIQKKLTENAISQAYELVSKKYKSLCIYIDDGHAGIHGISASRLKDKFGRPCIIFSPKLNEDGIISGSARSIDNLNIKEVLDIIYNLDPQLMLKYGGHHGAAGLTIHYRNFKPFKALFEKVVNQASSKLTFGPVIKTDGKIQANDISLATINDIKQLEPFGRGFEYPVFEFYAEICSIKLVGKDKNHAQIFLRLENNITIKGIWFNCEEYIHHIILNHQALIIGSLNESEFNGRINININIQHIDQNE